MVQLGFYILTLIMLFSIYRLFNFSENKLAIRKNFLIIITLWVVYVIIMANSGLLDSLSLPPRAPVFIILPAFVIIFITTSRGLFKQFLPSLSKSSLVYVQSFRILVELLIYGAFLEGAFSQRVTFEGLNFDILVGISALPMGYLIQKELIGRKGILAWNIMGLSVLSLTGYAFVSSFYFSDFVDSVGEIALVQLPYILLPAILLPIAIFYHVTSIRQNLKK